MPTPTPTPMLSPPRAAAFDLDGTLIDSAPDIASALNHVLEALGRERLPLPTVRGFIGDGARMLVARALALAPTDAGVERTLALFRERYRRHPCEATTLLPGAAESLDALAAARLALVTNKPRDVTLLVLDALGLTRRFAAIYAGGDGPLKPDPAAIQAVLGGVASADTWVIGDGPQDIAAGRAAGCVTVAVLGGYADPARLRGAGPDAILESLRELPPLIAAAAGGGR